MTKDEKLMQKMKMKRLSFLVGFCICFLISPAQRETIDSLINSLKIIKEDTSFINSLNALASAFRFNEPDTSILLGNRALIMAEKINWEKGIAKTERNLGTFYRLKGNYPDALSHYTRALAIYENINDGAGVGTTLGNIGNVYWNQNNYPKALDYYLKALNNSERLGDKNGIATNLGNIGSTYYNQGNYGEALDYYFKALKISDKVGDKNIITNNLGNIGGVYSIEGDLAGTHGDTILMKQKYYQALEYYFKALKVAQEAGNKNAIAYELGNIGALYISAPSLKPTQGENKKGLALAEEYLMEELKIQNEISSLEGLKRSHQSLSELYIKKGEFKSALEHYKQFISVRDSIFNRENIQKFVRTEMNYEFDKKETLARQSEQKQIVIRNAFIAGFVFVLILSILIFSGYRSKQKTNFELDIKNKKIETAILTIEKQKEMVDEKNNSLQRLLIDKELLLKEIHHRVKNNLQIISSLLNLQSSTMTDKKVINALKQSQSRVNTMAILHNKLYQTEDFSNVSISKYIAQLVSSISDSFKTEDCNIEFKIDADERIKFNIDTAIPLGLIINELITNAFKYAFIGKDKGIISIELHRSEGNNFRFTFGDNGSGLPNNFKEKLSQSIGLELVEMLVKQLNGSLEIINNNGVRFNISFVSGLEKEFV